MSREQAIEKMKKYRKRHKITAWRLAKNLGLRFQDVYYIESGKRVPSLKAACAIESLVGVPCSSWIE